jgi:predicted nucleotidyltransferase
MVRRPTSLEELVERYEPVCAGFTDAELEACWMESACRSLSAAARALGKSEVDVRGCAFRMLNDSTARLKITRDACEALSHRMESGIRSIIVAGSVARCEALPTSDVDFNVYVTDAYLRSLFTKRSAKAKTSHDLLVGLERELRKKMRINIFMEEMHQRGYAEWEKLPTLKPFTWEQLNDDESRSLATGHLLNLLFGAAPVLGEGEFDGLLNELLQDPDSIFAALLGRIALLHARRSLLEAAATVVPVGVIPVEQTSKPLNSLHTIAGAVSALLCVGLWHGDPQVPYWWTMDAIAASALEPATRETIEHFFVEVTLVRGGQLPYDPVALNELLERTLAALPAAIEDVVQWQAAQGASEETLELWDIVSQHVTNSRLSHELAKDLKIG